MSIVDGKAVLTLNKTYIEQEEGDGYYAIILNGETINLNGLSDDAAINITDGTGKVYGTINKSGNITLTEPAEGPRITEVTALSASSSSGNCYIYNGQYLGKDTVCKFSVQGDNNRHYLYIYNKAGAWVAIKPTSTQEAELVYCPDGGLSSAKNADILIFGCYALLPNGTRVEGDRGSGNLLADSQGNMSVCGGYFSADGIVPLVLKVGVSFSCPDSTGQFRSVTPLDGWFASQIGLGTEVDFKGTYDGSTGTLSLAQGAVAVNTGSDYYCYAVHAADKTIAIYQGFPSSFLKASFAYTDIDKVSLLLYTICAKTSTELSQRDYGLTQNTELKKITGTTLTLTAPKTMDAVAYLREDETRYATLAKTKNGYALTVEKYTSFTEVDFTGLGTEKVQVDAANLSPEVQYTTKGGAFTTTDKSFSVTQNDTLTTLEGADSANLLKAGSYSFTTATAVTLGTAGTYTLGGKTYAATTAAKFSVDGTTVKLTAGTVTLEDKGSITIGDAVYTASANNTTIAYDAANQGKLTAGAVTLAQGQSIATASGTITAQTGSFTVTGTGVVTGLGDKESFTAVVGGKTYTYTLDAKTKSITVTGAATGTFQYLDLSHVAFNLSDTANGCYGLTGLYDDLPANAAYDSAKNTITLKAAFTGKLDTARYAPTVQTVDGTAVDKGITLIGSTKAATLKGGKGGDTLQGSAGADKLYGNAGSDSILGGSGNDYIEGGAGNDYADGGAGNDTIKGISGTNKLYGGDGKDSILGGSGNDYIEAGDGNDYVSGGAGNDTIKGVSGTNSIYGGKGNDVLYGGKGKDTFYYAAGDGTDSIVSFEAGKDVIRYADGALKSVAIGKDKTVTLTHAKGTATGTQKLVGKGVKGQYADIVTAKGKTTATVRHNFGTYGAANSWTVDSANIGKQGFHGSTKTDTLNVTGKTAKTIDLADTALYTGVENVNASKATAALTIKGNGSANLLRAGSAGGKLYGGAGNDSLYGGGKNDYIDAGAGNDYVSGGAGNDTIKGTAGANSIYGGKGNDVLYGGKGKDTFYYAAGDGIDSIVSFEAGKDVIRYTNGALKSVSIDKNKNVILTHAKGTTTGSQKLMGRGVKGQYADIVTAKGKTTATVRHYFGTYGAANSWTVDSANIGKQGFHGSTKTDTLNVTGKTAKTIDLADTALYTSIDSVNATKATAALTIKGNASANLLKAGSGNTKLDGGAGKDTLVGGKGKDSLSGGAGNDTLWGGTGNDTLTGGAGKDIFLYSKGDGKDVIQSYTDAQTIKVLSGNVDSIYATGKHKTKKGYVEDVVLCIGSGSIRLDDVSLTSTVHVIASGKKKDYAVSSLKTR